mmetsp:Transcript_2184/g.4454  ORF Transcript_2184/g.4454 Transcript_2184/m.4454 type:complete len:259 (+) Transcript_2184:2156-2932(+)
MHDECPSVKETCNHHHPKDVLVRDPGEPLHRLSFLLPSQHLRGHAIRCKDEELHDKAVNVANVRASEAEGVLGKVVEGAVNHDVGLPELLYLVKHHHADRKQVQGNVAPCQHRGEDLKGLFFEKNFNDNEREDVNGQVGKAAEGVPPLEVPLEEGSLLEVQYTKDEDKGIRNHYSYQPSECVNLYLAGTMEEVKVVSMKVHKSLFHLGLKIFATPTLGIYGFVPVLIRAEQPQHLLLILSQLCAAPHHVALPNPRRAG